MDRETLARKIAEFEPVDGEWLELEDLLQEALSMEEPEYFYTAFFNLFERFPKEDGAGVFWTALHGMEHIGNYEKDLLRYFRRFPSLMTNIMLKRMANSGISEVSGVNIERRIS
jgi:hypothetical protein